MNDEQLLRYSRQMMLPQMDFEGQQRLLTSHALVIGLGGLGSPVALYLAAAGVGKLTLVDDDEVELSNLQRQIIHREKSVGEAKVASAADSIAALNKDIIVNTITQRLDQTALEQQVALVDVVVDCSDNFETRFLLNAVTQKMNKPLVSGAAIRMEGQITVYDPRQENSGCYRCLYQDEGELQQTCSEVGVLSPLLGVIGSIQAVETIKLLSEIGQSLAGRLLILDAFTMQWREIKLKPNPNCPICQSH
jgi:adenylyltransferase/sulfurtransferase